MPTPEEKAAQDAEKEALKAKAAADKAAAAEEKAAKEAAAKSQVSPEVAKLGEALAERETELSAVRGQLGSLAKENEELKAEKEALTKRAEDAERDRETFRTKLQQGKIGALDLAEGQAQLTDSITLINFKGQRVDAKEGDVIFHVTGDAGSEKVAALQEKIGKAYRVHGVTESTLRELVSQKFATSR